MSASADEHSAPPFGPAMRRHHRSMLWIALATVLLALALEVTPDREHVVVRGFPAAVMPGTCLSRELFHVSCPGCGLTRSIILLARGEWRASWRMHRLGWLLALVIVGQIPYRVLCLRRRAPVLGTVIPRIVGHAVTILLIANWLAEFL